MAERVGVYLIGARGNVACCFIAGTLGLAEGLLEPVGLVTAAPLFERLGLARPVDLEIGGCDIRPVPLGEAMAEAAAQTGAIPEALRGALAPRLAEIDARIDPVVALNCGAAVERLAPASSGGLGAKAAYERLRAGMLRFQERSRAARVVVVNLASTEAFAADPANYPTAAAVRRLIDGDRRELLSSSILAAAAALTSGFAYVNFTPSPGPELPGLNELSYERRAPHAGKDGKTGETLLKTVLGPMFAARGLRVLTWHGYNVLGNRDGVVLDDPASNRAKVRDKDAPLAALLGAGGAHLLTRIDYAPSLADGKVAMDYVHFQGFLGAKMALQFTWNGCDSALAAPLVLDLARLADLAMRRGERGAMTHTASFFKNPVGCPEHHFFRQFALLETYAAR